MYADAQAVLHSSIHAIMYLSIHAGRFLCMYVCLSEVRQSGQHAGSPAGAHTFMQIVKPCQ